MDNNKKEVVIPVKVQIINDKVTKAIKDGEKIKSITVRMEATHSGILNGNSWFYNPLGMEQGTETFTKPFLKPVKDGHYDGDVVGRVLEARYINYGSTPVSLLKETDAKYVNAVKKFMQTDQFKSKDYKGLGHVELISKITDEDAIEKALSQRFLTVSIGAVSDKVICSICGEDKVLAEDGGCEHYAGHIYNGERAFNISNVMTFDHIAYVDSPADPNAVTSVIGVVNDSDVCSLYITDCETTSNFNKENLMTYTMQQLSDGKSNKPLVDYALGLGLEGWDGFDIQDADQLDYLFVDSMTFPVVDKNTLVLTKLFFDDHVEDSADKKAAVAIIDAALKKMKIKDCKKELDRIKKEHAEKTKKVEDSTPEGTASVESTESTFDNEALAGAVATKVLDDLKKVLLIEDSYSATRISVMQNRLDAQDAQISDLKANIKELLIKQIVSLSDATDKEALTTKLNDRTIQSLKDKLNDLQDETNPQDSKNEGRLQTQEEKEINKVDISDSAPVEQDAEAEGEKDPVNKETDVKDSKVKEIGVAQAKDTYNKLLRAKGFAQANKWLADCVEDGTISSHTLDVLIS